MVQTTDWFQLITDLMQAGIPMRNDGVRLARVRVLANEGRS